MIDMSMGRADSSKRPLPGSEFKPQPLRIPAPNYQRESPGEKYVDVRGEVPRAPGTNVFVIDIS